VPTVEQSDATTDLRHQPARVPALAQCERP
jgi:hypothetical protein